MDGFRAGSSTVVCMRSAWKKGGKRYKLWLVYMIGSEGLSFGRRRRCRALTSRAGGQRHTESSEGRKGRVLGRFWPNQAQRSWLMLLAEGCTKKNEDRSAVAREMGTFVF